MAFKSLRDYINALEDLGQVRQIKGADCDLEIGAITELVWENEGPVSLFDDVKGFNKGYRIVTNLMDTLPRCALAIGLSPGCSKEEFIQAWKEVMAGWTPVPPRIVRNEEATVFQNKMTGDEIDMLSFPAPKWHELDGGPYIGTGVAVIQRDPDNGWVNLGAYRIMVHDKNTLGFYVSPGHHGRTIREKYWAKGESCPIALSFGQNPSLWIATCSSLPWGVSEYDLAGYLQGEPEEVVKGPITGLPIPAHAEIVVEGEIPPPGVESHIEGPFGEWTGYYASDARDEPVLKVKAVYFRDNPIHHGEPPFRPGEGFMTRPEISSAAALAQLTNAGIQDVRGVRRYYQATVISLKQRYVSHAKEAAVVLAQNSYMGGFIIVVDDDIDPWDPAEVVWAVSTRCEPAIDIDVLHGMRSSALDPKIPPQKRALGDLTAAVMLVNACRPYHWKDQFPPVNKISSELRDKTINKWGDVLGLK
ncbi:UbiD family decarboxylase [Dehalococcoidia bacterium]|nr:UbiD family decarboxylase [Dehalococcoidia bacterium]